jgi:very-short-patch-repair endonuclease
MKKHPVDGAGRRARRLRPNMTEAEIRVRRQVPIGRCIADFACPTLCARRARLIVEIDGGQHDPSSPRDGERSRFLRNEGYRVLRFWNNGVLATLDGVYETITGELGRITPTQTLPHRGGGLRSKNG